MTTTTAAGRLLSVNVGLPKDVEWEGRTVHTGIWKRPVDGPQMVRRLNIDGDGQGDLQGHGGVNRAVYVYQIESHRYWSKFLKRDDFTYGQFGENFTVEGLADDEVCVGDRYRIGSALFEVSQPRVTCYRLGIRLSEPQMPALLVAHHRPGFYFRVIEEGKVEAGDSIERAERGPEAMTVSEIDGLLYLPHKARRDLERALRIPALSPGWQGSFRDLLHQASDGAAGKPAWEGLRKLRVVALDRESENVISVRLVPADGKAAAPAQPGQFLTVRLRPDPEAPPLLRTYSLSDLPNAKNYRISVKREPHGAASGYINTKLHVGDVIEAGAPRGSFVLRPGDGPVVLISAGVGATPVLAMLHVLAAERSTRPVWCLYSAHNGAQHPFAKEAGALLEQLPDAHRVICYSHPAAQDRTPGDFDITGRLTADVIEQAGVPVDADFYLCGPTAFMHDVSAALTARGAAPDRVSAEVFGAEAAITPGVVGAKKRAPHQPPGQPGPGPSVSLSRSNLTVPWDPAFASLLELAEACDVPVRWSCRTGVCHTCVTGLVSGKVSYRPDPLEPPEEGSILICCSRPDNEIMLDL
jgi:ferredoxin-NADP reductase/MOSC domain-containing protein YiiM/ferredoxin